MKIELDYRPVNYDTTLSVPLENHTFIFSIVEKPKLVRGNLEFSGDFQESFSFFFNYHLLNFLNFLVDNGVISLLINKSTQPGSDGFLENKKKLSTYSPYRTCRKWKENTCRSILYIQETNSM